MLSRNARLSLNFVPFHSITVEVSRLPGATSAKGTSLGELRLPLVSYEADYTVVDADFFLLNLTLNKLNKQNNQTKNFHHDCFSTIDFVDFAYLDCLECITRTEKYVCTASPVGVTNSEITIDPPSLTLDTFSRCPNLCVLILLSVLRFTICF